MDAPVHRLTQLCISSLASVPNIHIRDKQLEVPMTNGVSGKGAAAFKFWSEKIMYGKEEREGGVVGDMGLRGKWLA